MTTGRRERRPVNIDSPLLQGSTTVKVVHFHQLRDAVIALEAR